MYLAYARSTVAWRQVMPAASTSALKPSISLKPSQTARIVSWNGSRALSGMPGA